MARVLIGNFKGPKGDKGADGAMGPQGPKGEQGPTGLVNGNGILEFEDYSAEGTVVPSPEEAFAEIISGKSLKSIISSVKAFCKGVVTLGMIVDNLDDALAITDDKIPVGCKAFQGLNAKMIVGWGAREKISLPYTATSDGLLVLYFQSASSSGGNYYVTRDGDSNIALAASSNGSAITVSTFAQEGDNFTFLSSDNYGFASLEFIPFAKAG